MVSNSLKKLECDQCDKSFNTKTCLNRHKDAVHLKLRPFKCDFCDQTFAQKINKIVHGKKCSQKNASKLKPYECSECGKCFSEDYEIVNHVHAAHVQKNKTDTVNKPHITQEKTATKPETEKAVIKKKKVNIKCDICDKAFRNRAGLKLHVKRVHNGFKPFECDHCGKMSSYKQAMDLHVKTVHLGLKPFKCDKCDESFKSHFSMKKHKKAQKH